MNEILLFKIANQLSNLEMSKILNIELNEYLKLESVKKLKYPTDELLEKYSDYKGEVIC